MAHFFGLSYMVDSFEPLPWLAAFPRKSGGRFLHWVFYHQIRGSFGRLALRTAALTNLRHWNELNHWLRRCD